MGFALPGSGGNATELERGRAAATGLQASHLSPLDRTSTLPPHHPHTGAAAAYPYPLWSGGIPPEPAPRAPEVVDLRSDALRVRVDLTRGGRIVAMAATGSREWAPVVRPVSEADDVRGVGLRGGLEFNSSPFPRSPLALDPVFAAVGLVSRLGGDRLRWWQLERASGHLAQVDIHVLTGRAQILVAVRQVPVERSASLPSPRWLVDDVTAGQADGPRIEDAQRVGEFVGARIKSSSHRTAETSGVSSVDPLGQDGNVSWFSFTLDGEDVGITPDELEAIVAGLDDPVLKSTGRLISHGNGWAALEMERLAAEGKGVPFNLEATPLASLEHEDLSNRRRAVPETQWLHLLHDEGLGVSDRVHPRDVGQPAGPAWTALLQRSHRREALGDWRVHLRQGELAYLAGDLEEAFDRWSWSYALRPTAWSDRNLGLVHLANGEHDAAAISYLRAQRTETAEIELAIEAVGVLVRTRRARDARQVLDRLVLAGYGLTARTWLLEAEVALALDEQGAVDEFLTSAAACADWPVHRAWAHSLAQTACGSASSP